MDEPTDAWLREQLDIYRGQIEGLNEQLVGVANEAARFMKRHCKVKVGDRVWWKRTDQPDVLVEVTYVEGVSYRFIFAYIEQPPVRGRVVMSNGELEPGPERHLFCHYRKEGDVDPKSLVKPKVRQRTPLRPPADDGLMRQEDIEKAAELFQAPVTARARVRPGTPVQSSTPASEPVRVRRRPL